MLPTLDELIAEIVPDASAARRRSLKSRFAEVEMAILKRHYRMARESLRLYRPLPIAAEFHHSAKPIRLITGSNRGGKTVAVAKEVAQAVCGKHPRLPRKDGMCVAVGKDESHVGLVMWKMLSQPGQFKIVPDEKFGTWRAVRPWSKDPLQIDPIDLERKHLWRPSEPFIPSYMIDEIAWSKKNRQIPVEVRMKSGWMIKFGTGKGNPPQGIQTNLIWFDEEIDNDAWYSEMVARMVDRYDEGSMFLWSCTPQAGTQQLADLHAKCEAGNVNIAEFKVLIDENPYLDRKAKQQFFDTLTTEEDIEVRYRGNYAVVGRRIYPMYEPTKHNIKEFGAIPDDWARYMFIDPGQSKAGALMVAVPPDGRVIHCYDELFIRHCSAEKFADEAALAIEDDVFIDFIFDNQMGRQSQASGKTVKQHYAEEFQNRGLLCQRRGTGFANASPNIDARTDSAKMLLTPDGEGEPRVVIHEDNCPQLVKQLQDARYQKNNPTRRVKQPDELVDCFEYMAEYRPTYVKPKPRNLLNSSAAVKHLEEKRRRNSTRNRLSGVYVAGAPSPR